MVIHLTAAKLKPLIFSVSGFTFSDVMNISIFMILYDCCYNFLGPQFFWSCFSCAVPLLQDGTPSCRWQPTSSGIYNLLGSVPTALRVALQLDASPCRFFIVPEDFTAALSVGTSQCSTSDSIFSGFGSMFSRLASKSMDFVSSKSVLFSVSLGFWTVYVAYRLAFISASINFWQAIISAIISIICSIFLVWRYTFYHRWSHFWYQKCHMCGGTHAENNGF
jgi:hypothetical protein